MHMHTGWCVSLRRGQYQTTCVYLESFLTNFATTADNETNAHAINWAAMMALSTRASYPHYWTMHKRDFVLIDAFEPAWNSAYILLYDRRFDWEVMILALKRRELIVEAISSPWVIFISQDRILYVHTKHRSNLVGFW